MVLKNSGRYRPDYSKESSTRSEDNSETRLRHIVENESIDLKYGFERLKHQQERTGFLLNMHSNEIVDEDKRLCSAMDFYFMEEDGTRFKVTYPFQPYFYILTRSQLIQEFSELLLKKYTGIVIKIEIVQKEDLSMPNHLAGLKQKYIKLYFANQTDLTKVRKELLKIVKKNKDKENSNTYYMEILSTVLNNTSENALLAKKDKFVDIQDILDIREHDVPYHVRVSIDMKIFCGSWYTIKGLGPNCPPLIMLRSDLIERPEPIVLAFDIETTKLPLKFPDSSTDQIMLISYMIDAQGYLITNREIISSDINDFEYTPKQEFEGKFTVFNEPNEMALLQKFFDHILEIRPHIFVTYNGDMFDWPFVEARAAFHNLDMRNEIGFSKNRDGVYFCRTAIHMDCLCWVKRDSYLPVGSHNLKAVAKAKLRYDPVELDPEEMCMLATAQPQILATYSVSDAVATYYLYMQYVHPFIFALCTIIPCEPDEVLRKGSGTLCESLLMVEAFHANIIFPNKEEMELNKLTQDGHVLLQETYVGGHVEALESGVFRADIPCRFRIDTEAVDELINQISKTLEHAIVIEEGIPLDCVLNFETITEEIKTKLISLKEQPMRLERPLIYHLDVGAMYPNIILTNRLQPCAIVNETLCASCDFNKPKALCKRNMTWMMREEYMPASRNEYHRIQQQLETEKFSSFNADGQPRAFHQLSKQEQAEIEKKRLSIYCRRVYKKIKCTRVEERTTTICQRENSFYVDTVRAFRDRRYEYKGLSKQAKQAVSNAIKDGDASEIKSAKNREVLYDSLQLAHKCILNSFYGYVMRKGARWHSMEMAGIVCYTGANIITKAREIIEKIGRPLELDTDGIWCILPASFPENFTVLTNHEKKKKFNLSYPNAILNTMVKECFTNNQYHELTDPKKMVYTIKSENSIFFEVDGPYKAMVLPASKEEGKKLKKRYAVFNFDGSLAELKGFEVKRRGELQLIKNFQSSVFESFLKGNTLETCYAHVAQVADYWLDVLFSRGRNMPDSELFNLISENRSMSKRLEEYGEQKSSSISTAKRLAEFLGDQMIKDAGLACKYVIAKKPEGAPVTERAIPLAIFQAEESIQKHYLKKWLKDNTINQINIRDILDWNYYIERLGGAVQKIITIPAAMQGVPNPVPRISHPDWLHKKILEKTDNFRQRRITDIFLKKKIINQDSSSITTGTVVDIEDSLSSNKSMRTVAAVIKRKRDADNEFLEEDLNKTWREVLGNPPPLSNTKEQCIAWVLFQKRKWRFQLYKKNTGMTHKRNRFSSSCDIVRNIHQNSLGGFLHRTKKNLLMMPWQILQIIPINSPGEFRLWTLVNSELHSLKLKVPRIFYANLRTPKVVEKGALFKKCNRILPRGKHVYNLYRYRVSEELFQQHGRKLYFDQTDPNVEGVYETQVTPLFRALIQIGCVCKVATSVQNIDEIELEDLEMISMARQTYLPKDSVKHLYFYHHRHTTKYQHIFALFANPIKQALIVVVDTVRTNLMPNMAGLYKSERTFKTKKISQEHLLPPEDLTFEVRIETDLKTVYKLLQKKLQLYKDEKKGPTLLAIQSTMDINELQRRIPSFSDYPQVQIHIKDIEELFNVIEWQKVGAKAVIRHYLNSEMVLDLMEEQCRYFHLPLGNLPADPAVFGSDLFFARQLIKHNHILWYSLSDKPDLGGSEENDARITLDNQDQSSEVCNIPGWYASVSLGLDVDSLAINTLLQSNNITDMEGIYIATAFDTGKPNSVDDMMSANQTNIYDENTKCAEAFKILRTMAAAWMRDISLYRNVYADFQVVHFYRWLRSPKSSLYEPALLEMLQNLMKKLFLQLLTEFQKLGCTLIYANFNKIVICTKKNTIEDAEAHINFVIQSIKNKELFHSVDLSKRQCWKLLVWLDFANYAGVEGHFAEEIENTTTEVLENEITEDLENQNEPNIINQWNIAELLPKQGNCRRSFYRVIAGYIYALYNQINKNKDGSRVITSQLTNGLLNENDIAFAKYLLAGEISQTMFQMTEKINSQLPALDDGTSASLNFINIVCHIFGLDVHVKDAVDNLKSNLLRLIGIGEFSEKANWMDPTVTYIIPQVICKSCNHCRDIDLGRDQYRSDVSWFCPLCNSSYDNVEIECFLLDIMNKKSICYNLQDLNCKKCREVKLENLSTHCQCSSEFSCSTSKNTLLKLLQIFKTLGEKFNMYAVKQTTDQILSLV